MLGRFLVLLAKTSALRPIDKGRLGTARSNEKFCRVCPNFDRDDNPSNDGCICVDAELSTTDVVHEML